MATLKTTTATTFQSNTTATGSVILTSADSSIQQWAGYVFIVTPYYDPVNNYADVIVNNNGYSWICGTCDVGANQSYNTSHQFWFGLSRYGLKVKTGPTWDSLMSLSVYQNPSNPNINALRITNTYNASWANGHYHFNFNIFTGNSASSITSSYVSRLN